MSAPAGSGNSKGKQIVYTPPGSPSPPGSLHDLSDYDETEYNTITHTSSGRGVKLLHTKSKVYVHPTRNAKDNIPGFIALVQQKPPPSASSSTSSVNSSTVPVSTLLLAWLPESQLGNAYSTYVKVDLIDDSSDTRQTYLVPPPPGVSTTASATGTYAFAVPVAQIYSIILRPPNSGWTYGSLVINTRAGDSFPALFFHDKECPSTVEQTRKRIRDFDPFGEGGNSFWGGEEVLRWMRKYARIEHSGLERDTYLVEPSSKDEKPWKPRMKEQEDNFAGASANPRQNANVANIFAGGFDKVFKEVKWNVLERLSRVTNFSKQTAAEVLESPNMPPQLKRLLKTPEVAALQDEFDSARIYLARWAMAIAEQADKEKRKTVWSSNDVMRMEDSELGQFEILDIAVSRDGRDRKPLTLQEWNGWLNREGKLTRRVDEVKERIFHDGLDPGARKELWLWLLNIFPWDSTLDERKAIMASKRDEYVRLKANWWNELPAKLTDEHFIDQRNRIEKDVHRTDRTVPLFAGENCPHPDPGSPYADVGTNEHLEQMKDMLITYNEYNTTLGYVQGMSDLLAPIYAVMQDDAMAFWAFCQFMKQMERNFLRDQSGMRNQLVTIDHLVQLMDPKLYLHLKAADSADFFFLFRMLLIWFKREFPWEDVLVLWETLWTNYYSSQFVLFIALALLEKHRNVVMNNLTGFDTILKYFNELSGTIDLSDTRIRAEHLFKQFEKKLEYTDRKAVQQRESEALTWKNLVNVPGTPATPNSTSTPPMATTPTAVGSRPGPRSGQRAATTAATVSAAGAKPGEELPTISPELRKLLSREIITAEGLS